MILEVASFGTSSRSTTGRRGLNCGHDGLTVGVEAVTVGVGCGLDVVLAVFGFGILGLGDALNSERTLRNLFAVLTTL